MRLIDLNSILNTYSVTDTGFIDYAVNESSEIVGKFKLTGNQHLEIKINLIHKLPNIKSRIKIICAALDEASSNIEAKLVIEKGAKGVDTFLKIDGYIFGENASIKATPSLEISENDVKAGHGAAVGYIEKKIINYSNTRGLTDLEIENMILESVFE